MVYLGIGAGAIEQALDAHQGAALFDNQDFQELTGRLPSTRLLTLYARGEVFKDLYPLLLAHLDVTQGLAANLPVADLDMVSAWQSSASALTVFDEGMNIDSAILFDKATTSPAQERRISQAGGALRVVDALPDSTYIFLSGRDIQQVWDLLRSLGSGGDPTRFAQLGALFKSEIGFNPETDLLPYAQGEWASGLFTTQDGVFARAMQEETGLPAGLIFTLGVNDERRMQKTLDGFVDWARRSGLIVTNGSGGNSNFYHLTNQKENLTVLTINMSQGHLDISTSNEPWGASSGPITQDADYQAVWGQLSEDMTITYYINFTRFLQLFQSDPEVSADIAALRALRAVASARRHEGASTLLNRVVILIQP
jgi:hypothetical protein